MGHQEPIFPSLVRNAIEGPGLTFPRGRPGAGLGPKVLRHRHEPTGGQGHSELWPSNRGRGVTGPTAPLLRPNALAGRGEVVGAGMDTAARGRVMGKLVVLHTNYISNQPARGAGINLPGGQLCESSWN